MRDDPRHIGAEEGIEQEHGSDDGKGGAERPAGGFQQKQHPDHGHHEVLFDRRANTVGDVAVEHEQIGRTDGADKGEDDVQDRNVIAGRAAKCRIGQECEEDREGQMDRARLGIVKHADVQREGQR